MVRPALIRGLALALVLGCLCTNAAAQATAYVPVDDPAYVDLDVLVAYGLVDQLVAGERPHSRASFTRFAEEARARSAYPGAPSTQRLREALERLMQRFTTASRDSPPTRVRLDRVTASLTGASSPSRGVRSGTVSTEIDGDLNPLLERNLGRVLADGWTGAVEVDASFESRALAASVAPRLSLSTVGAGGNTLSGTIRDAYVRSVVGSVAAEVGRSHVRLGHGRVGGPVLSENPRGLDMVRISQERPLRLPGFLSGLGRWQMSGLLARMEEERDTPRSYLGVFRVSSRHGRHVELGFTYLNHQGGEGAPEASFGDRLKDYLLLYDPQGAKISDKVIGIDVKLTSGGVVLFANTLLNDDKDFFRQPTGGLWEDAVYVVGTSLFGLGPEGRVDLWAEWRHAGASAHTHAQFTSGLTLDGRLLGDPLGPNASSLEGGVDWNGTTSSVSLSGAWERYSGDVFQRQPPEPGSDLRRWIRIEDNPDEVRRRVALGWSWFDNGVQTWVRLGYERVTRFNFNDSDRSNVLGQAGVTYVW